MQIPKQIVIATGNNYKVREFKAITDRLIPEVEILALSDLALQTSPPDDIEIYETFEENALAKAKWASSLSGSPALADDSGLMVDALDGRPGVRSNRWAGPTDRDRNRRLLEELTSAGAIETSQRGAKFVCAVALVVPGCKALIARGELQGSISIQPSGDSGFGYDPIFILAEYGLTVAQLSGATKNEVSHRAVAFQALLAAMRQ